MSPDPIKGPDIPSASYQSYLNLLDKHARTLFKDKSELTNDENRSIEEKTGMIYSLANAPAPDSSPRQFVSDLRRTKSFSFITPSEKSTEEQSLTTYSTETSQNIITLDPTSSDADIENALASLSNNKHQIDTLRKWLHQGGLTRMHQQIISYNQTHQLLDFYNQTGKDVKDFMSDYVGQFGYPTDQEGQTPPEISLEQDPTNPSKFQLTIKAEMLRIIMMKKNIEPTVWQADPNIHTFSVTKLSLSFDKLNKLSYSIDSCHLESTIDESIKDTVEIEKLSSKALTQMSDLSQFLGLRVPKSLQKHMEEEKLAGWIPNKYVNNLFKNECDYNKTQNRGLLDVIKQDYFYPFVFFILNLLQQALSRISNLIRFEESSHKTKTQPDYPPKPAMGTSDILSPDNSTTLQKKTLVSRKKSLTGPLEPNPYKTNPVKPQYKG